MNPFYGRLSGLLLKCASSGRPARLLCVGSWSAPLNILWPFVCHFWQCCHWLWNPEESVWPSYISISSLLDYHRFSWPCLRWCIKRVPSSPWYKALLTTLSLSLFLSLSLSLSPLSLLFSPSLHPLDFFSCSSCLSLLPSLLFLPPSFLPPLYSGPICAASAQCIMYKELFIFDACCGQIRGLGDKM